MPGKPQFSKGPRLTTKDGRNIYWSDLIPDLTSFDESLTASRNEIFGLTRVDDFRDDITEENGAQVNNDRRSLSTGTNSGGRVLIETKERVQYRPGTTGEVGVFKQISRDLSGNEFVEYLAGDGTDGIGWRFDSSGPQIVIDDNGSRTTRSQSEWNIDTMDGSGDRNNPSGLKLRATDRDVLYMRIVWYGAGPIEWLILKGRNAKRDVLPVHAENLDDTVDLPHPNQPLRIEADNNGETDGFDVTLRGRQFTVLTGRTQINERRVSEFKLRQEITGTTWEPIMTLRKKSEYPPNSGNNNTTKIDLLRASLAPDNPALFRITFDDTLGSPSTEDFTDPSGWGAQSAVEVDTSPDNLGLTAGFPILYDLFESASSNDKGVAGGSTERDIGAPLGDATLVTLWGRKIASGDTNPTVSAVMEWGEKH